MDATASGWIKAHRKLREWEWYTDSKCVHLFLHLLLTANHAARRYRGHLIEPGQLVTSRDRLSIETGISHQSIRSTLKKLEATGEISVNSTNRFSIITICNWATYQSDGVPANQPTNQQPTNNQPTTNQPSHKNGKNEKNGKRIKKTKAKKNDELSRLRAVNAQCPEPEGWKATL